MISLIKYTPQLHLNWQRKSTFGFAIGMTFCDLTGGLLCILQQLVACRYNAATGNLRAEWTWATLNTPALYLGLVMILYDLAFVYQHFVLYPPRDVPVPRLATMSPHAAVLKGNGAHNDGTGGLAEPKPFSNTNTIGPRPAALSVPATRLQPPRETSPAPDVSGSMEPTSAAPASCPQLSVP